MQLSLVLPSSLPYEVLLIPSAALPAAVLLLVPLSLPLSTVIRGGGTWQVQQLTAWVL